MTEFWFRPKRYGYGVTPITWEGWALIFGPGVFLAGWIFVIDWLVDHRWGVVATLVAFTPGVVAWIWSIRVARRRTNGEWRWRWRWGERSDTTKK